MSSHAQPRIEPVLVPIKMRPELRRRFRLAAVEADLTYAQLIERWLDADAERSERQRRKQVHPFHRPED
ncbi:ribbon-helix-helix DNA binding domain protein [Mycobacterium phage Indlovu]|nr:ribbon-helix-helix DNA binding domain protein [Mycobacterium phage Indlovu]